MKNYVKSTSLPCITLASILLSYTATAAEIIEIKKPLKEKTPSLKKLHKVLMVSFQKHQTYL